MTVALASTIQGLLDAGAPVPNETLTKVRDLAPTFSEGSAPNFESAELDSKSGALWMKRWSLVVNSFGVLRDISPRQTSTETEWARAWRKQSERIEDTRPSDRGRVFSYRSRRAIRFGRSTLTR